MNLNDQTFMYNNNKVELTKNEYRILQCLLENVGKVVSRDSIMEKLWEDEAFVDDNTLTVNVTRLRRKLEDAGVSDYIRTKKEWDILFHEKCGVISKKQNKGYSDACGNCDCAVCSVLSFIRCQWHLLYIHWNCCPLCWLWQLFLIIWHFTEGIRRLSTAFLCDEIFQVELYDTSDAIEDDYQQLLTKVLTQKYQANELREKSMADLRDYYAIWAHQIKTPISTIDVLLQAENEPDKIDLKELKRQLFNIDFYVDAVMNYLRLEDMSSDYVFEDCQVEKIVRKAVKKFAAQFIGKKISIELNNLDTNVKTDEKWLGFIIEQLISNAVKYTRNGGKISIYMKETFNSADRILVIEDNGIGITKEDIPRIFERGYTGYNGRMSKNHRESVCTFAGKQQISWGFLLQ